MFDIVPFSFDQIILTIFMGLLIYAALRDICTYTISNGLNLTIAFLFPIYVLFSPHTIDWSGTFIVAGIIFAGGVVLFALRALGGGDVKLLAATALWAGPGAIFDFLLVTTITGGVMAIVMSSRSRFALAMTFEAIGRHGIRDAVLSHVLPYGVAIAAGGIAVAAKLWV